MRQQRLSRFGWATALAMLDIAGVSLAGAAALHLCLRSPDSDLAQLWIGLTCFIPAWLLNSWLQDLYADKVLFAAARRHVFRGLMTCVMAFGGVLLAGVALNWIAEASRAWLLMWAFGSSLWIGGVRVAWVYCSRALLRRGAFLERVLVVAGSRPHARRLGDRIESESLGRISVVGAVAFPDMPDGVAIEWIEETVREGAIDRIVITGFDNVKEQCAVLLERLMWIAVDVTVIPDLGGLPAPVRNVDCIGGLPAIGLASRPLTAMELTIKRAEDLVLGCLLALAVAPIAAIIALIIKIDSPGPVLFTQLREGCQGRVFTIWKFRTMFHDAPSAGALVQTSKHDSRVTRVGRFLRRLSLDELPQFINVIRGEMSLVGPRPHAVGMTFRGEPMSKILTQYPARHRLKPGITGLAQVNGCRGEIDSYDKLRRRVSLDCYYIDHWSLQLDIRIILQTLTRLPFDIGAY